LWNRGRPPIHSGEGQQGTTAESHTAEAARSAAAARRPASRFRFRPQYLTLAATLVLGVGAAVYLTRPGPGQILFQQHFEPYPSTRPVVRGGSTDDRSSALALYEAGDYRGALVALSDGLKAEPNDPTIFFYRGLSRLALGQAQEAAADLEQVLRLPESELQAPAAWYLALAHLRANDLAAARSNLERIAKTGGFYQNKARGLLAELERRLRY
jgi:hypothetical protein